MSAVTPTTNSPHVSPVLERREPTAQVLEQAIQAIQLSPRSQRKELPPLEKKYSDEKLNTLRETLLPQAQKAEVSSTSASLLYTPSEEHLLKNYVLIDTNIETDSLPKLIKEAKVVILAEAHNFKTHQEINGHTVSELWSENSVFMPEYEQDVAAILNYYHLNAEKVNDIHFWNKLQPTNLEKGLMGVARTFAQLIQIIVAYTENPTLTAEEKMQVQLLIGTQAPHFPPFMLLMPFLPPLFGDKLGDVNVRKQIIAQFKQLGEKDPTSKALAGILEAVNAQLSDNSKDGIRKFLGPVLNFVNNSFGQLYKINVLDKIKASYATNFIQQITSKSQDHSKVFACIGYGDISKNEQGKLLPNQELTHALKENAIPYMILYPLSSKDSGDEDTFWGKQVLLKEEEIKVKQALTYFPQTSTSVEEKLNYVKTLPLSSLKRNVDVFSYIYNTLFLFN